MRTFSRFAASAVAVLAVSVLSAGLVAPPAIASAASGKLTTKNPYRIFAPVDRTGVYAGPGGYYAAGLNAAVAYVNKHGGILHRKVVVTYADDHSVAQTASSVTTSAVASHKYQLVIPATINTGAVVQITTRYHALSIGTGGTATWGNGSKYPLNFSTTVPNAVQTALLACLVEKKYHPKAVAYLWVNTQSFISGIPGFDPVWKKYGVKVVASEPFTFNATTISPQVEKIMTAKPTVLVVGAYFGSLGVAIKGIDALNYTVPIAGNTETTAAPPSQFISSSTPYPKDQIGMQWAVNSRVNNQFSAAQKQAISSLKNYVHGTYPVVIATYLYTYDAVMLAKWAATHAQSTKVTAMVKALESLGANPGVKTGALISSNPQYTKTTHWNHMKYYAVTILSDFDHGTFPTVGNQPIASCA